MLETALTQGNPGAVRIGVASHNLFEIAYALVVAEHLGATERIDLEMLEGMAPAQARAVRERFGELLLYAPVVEKSDREASIAYLSRRLDENSAPENFLRSLFDITPGSPAWHREAARFRDSVRDRHTVATAPQRTQVRPEPFVSGASGDGFRNAPDTDFTRPANRAWIAQALAAATTSEPVLVTAGDRGRRARGPSPRRRRPTGLPAPGSSAGTSSAAVASLMESERGQTLALMATTAGKTVAEGDPEVSEAVDFARFAAHLTHQHEDLIAAGLEWAPSRVVVVAGPWNFPYAIPASGLVHAIAAGSAAIMKPAPETRAVAAHLVDQLLRAGVPEGLVQLAATPDNEVGQRLITHEDVDLVMLTGSYDTASMFLGWRPDLNITAETSGKNALVITAAADIDQAIKDLVRSAFGHSGQKCSAASLAIVEASVYDDESFHRRLADAVTSLKVGSPLDPATKAGPLISPPTGNLERALTSLEAGERWLVEPRQLDDSGTVWSPGVRVDVQPGSWFHLTECFGPVLGLMRAESLDDAIALQNAPIYGLTGGLHSLDPKEIDHWLARVHVGNAYVNRHITGAIVQRQPFGGWKASSIGSGHKPGGPNHLHGYGTWTDPSIDPAACGRLVPPCLGRSLLPRERPDRPRLRAELPALPPADRGGRGRARRGSRRPDAGRARRRRVRRAADVRRRLGLGSRGARARRRPGLRPHPSALRRLRRAAGGRACARGRRRPEPDRRRRARRTAPLAARAGGVAHDAPVRAAAARVVEVSSKEPACVPRRPRRHRSDCRRCVPVGCACPCRSS